MKLKFDPSLGFQQDAINAVVAAFDGQPIDVRMPMKFTTIHDRKFTDPIRAYFADNTR